MPETSALERSIVIQNRFGMHARPAAEFVKLANRFQSDVWVKKDDLEVNAKSIMGVMMLAAEFGSEITIRAQGDDAPQALLELCALVDRRFGEE